MCQRPNVGWGQERLLVRVIGRPPSEGHDYVLSPLSDYEALCELFRSLDEGERTRWKTTTIFEITIPWW